MMPGLIVKTLAVHPPDVVEIQKSVAIGYDMGVASVPPFPHAPLHIPWPYVCESREQQRDVVCPSWCIGGETQFSSL